MNMGFLFHVANRQLPILKDGSVAYFSGVCYKCALDTFYCGVIVNGEQDEGFVSLWSTLA